MSLTPYFRCWAFGLLLLLFTFPIAGQQTSSGNLSAEPADKLAATAKAGGERRVDQFKRALNWYAQDSFARCRQTIDSLARQPSGELIVDSLSGLAYHMAGMTFYQVYDDVNAVPQYLRAIQIRDACYPDLHSDQAHTRYNLANSLHWLGRPDTATYLLREAIDIYDNLDRKDTTNWLRSLKLLGVIAKESNDRELTRNTTVAMVDLLGRFTQPTAIDKYQMYYDAGDNFQYLGKFEEAIHYGKLAVAAGKAMGDPSMEADALNVVATNQVALGQFKEARAGYEASIRLLKEGKGTPSSLGIAYGNLANIAREEGNYTAALEYIQKADNYPINPEYPEQGPDKRLNHAYVLEAMGRLDDALEQYGNAMQALARGGAVVQDGAIRMMPDSILNLPMAIILYGRRAKLLSAQGKSKAALSDLNELFALQDIQRERVTSSGSRYALSKEVWPYYDAAIGLYLELYAADQEESHLWRAFELSEGAKAYSQLAALSQSRAAMGHKEQDFRRRIARLQRATAGESTNNVRLAEQELRLELLLRSQRNVATSVATAPDRATLLAFLQERSLSLVEYHLGEQRGFAFYLPPGGELSVYPLPGVDSLNRLTERWRENIAASSFRNKSLRSVAEQTTLDEAFLQNGLLLRQLLLPMLTQENVVGSGRLCIIPDGVLHFLPFAALPLEEVDVPINYQEGIYLQDVQELQQAYAARYLLELEARPGPEYSGNLLAFAPSFRGEASAGEVSRARSARAERVLTGKPATGTLPALQPLQYNISEVKAIANLISGSETYLDVTATRQAFLQSLGADRILHLSSHGMVHPTDPNLSFVAFAQQGEVLEEDELLYFNDLSTLPLDAEMVVLSACETSLGLVVPGETVLSLGSAFAAAGARSTLSSLWQVDDAATEALMIDFYAGLADGQSRSAALAAAQRSQKAKGAYAHPYYWSGMVLQGKAGKLALPTGPNWWLYGGGVLLLFGLGLWAGTRVRGKG